MVETRERLSRALLRTPMVERDTLLVTSQWSLWYEQQFRVQTGMEDGLIDVEANPEQGDVAVSKRRESVVDIPVVSEHEARRVGRNLQQVQSFSDVPQLEDLVSRAFAVSAQFAAGEGAPPAAQALNLGRRNGEYYRRWALAI